MECYSLTSDVHFQTGNTATMSEAKMMAEFFLRRLSAVTPRIACNLELLRTKDEGSLANAKFLATDMT